MDIIIVFVIISYLLIVYLEIKIDVIKNSKGEKVKLILWYNNPPCCTIKRGFIILYNYDRK